MSVPRNHPEPESMGEWMNQRVKREMHEARRPVIRRASDLLGPGFGPYAIEVRDWNSEETTFNGFYFSEPGALHSPDFDLIWLGLCIGTPIGHGVQQLFSHAISGDVPPERYIRSFHTHGTETPIFSAWTELA